MGERETEKKTLKHATTFATSLSPGTGSLKLFTLILSFSSSVLPVSSSLINQECGDQFVAVL